MQKVIRKLMKDAEVICKVDTSSYDIRAEGRKRADEMKKKMDEKEINLMRGIQR